MEEEMTRSEIIVELWVAQHVDRMLVAASCLTWRLGLDKLTDTLLDHADSWYWRAHKLAENL